MVSKKSEKKRLARENVNAQRVVFTREDKKHKL